MTRSELVATLLILEFKLCYGCMLTYCKKNTIIYVSNISDTVDIKINDKNYLSIKYEHTLEKIMGLL